MASPSRSSSVARYSSSAFFRAALRSLTVLLLPAEMAYIGSKSFSILIENLPTEVFLSSDGTSLVSIRSRMCPTEAKTSKSLPRYLPMVFALAGDSTMTSFRLFATHCSLFQLPPAGPARDEAFNSKPTTTERSRINESKPTIRHESSDTIYIVAIWSAT